MLINSIIFNFQLWSDNCNLHFHRTSSSNAVIKIRFARRNHGDISPFDGRGGVLAHAFFPRYNSSTHFDSDENYQKLRSKTSGGKYFISWISILGYISHNQ